MGPMYIMFRRKEYSPIGPKINPLDSDSRFFNKKFDEIYKTIPDLQTLRNELWSGIHKGK